MPRGWITRSSYATPFALVRRGGAAPGKRQQTRIAFITEAVAEGGRIVHYRGYVGNAALTVWTKHQHRIELEHVVCFWRSRPSPASIARAKAKMAKTPPAGAHAQSADSTHAA